MAAVYHLTFQYRSNEYPWSGSCDARGIETDEDAIKWAQYFVDNIGEDYQITLYKNGLVLPIPEPVNTTDIPETDEDWFKTAQLRRPHGGA